MNRRFTISGLEHLIRLLNMKPELLSLASMSQIQNVAQEAREASKSCSCNIAKVYHKHKGVFEVALNNLQYGDHILMKRILNVDSLCYYVKESNGGLKLKCI